MQDVRDGSRDLTSRALDTSWHKMNSLILIPVFVCPASNLSQQHEGLPCPTPASCRDTTSSPSRRGAPRGPSTPQPRDSPARSGKTGCRTCFRGWEPCPVELRPGSFLTAQSSMGLEYFLDTFASEASTNTFSCVRGVERTEH